MNQELMTLDFWQDTVIYKMLRALSDSRYAKGSYEKEMEQDALMEEATK